MLSAITKQCACCREAKSTAEFNRDNQKRDGLTSYCRPCEHTKKSAAYAARPKRNRSITATEKRCPQCQEIKPAAEFKVDPATVDGLRVYCKPCGNARNNERQARPENRAKATLRRRRERETVLRHYGGKCACCGELRHEFLAIDHIDGGGNVHRRELRSYPLTQWLIRNALPEGFQVLCHNCNMAKGFYGVCPHTQRAVRIVG